MAAEGGGRKIIAAVATIQPLLSTWDQLVVNGCVISLGWFLGLLGCEPRPWPP